MFMRSDAETLLARLGRTDFRYREFSDSFADMELWPIFEALLKDERVVGRRLSPLDTRDDSNIITDARQRAATPSPPGTGTAGIFGAYAPAQGGRDQRPSVDVRNFLAGLSANKADRHD